jgi:prephenate dehydratase
MPTKNKITRKPVNELGIAIQGYEGSFHQVAACTIFGKDVAVVPCATFSALIKKAENKKVSAGAIMAIENSIAGSILPNYNLLLRSTLKVTGEVYLSISQNLLVNKGVKLSDIKEVHSHPMALLQCLDYLEKNNWKLVESEDTALSAKHLQQHRSKHIAAVASKLAAELFNLDIIGPDIQTQKNNYTRFLVLERAVDVVEDILANKASIYFQTNHTKGVLAKVLTQIAKQDVNLTKLQSMPIPGSNFKYGFFADMEFDKRKKLDQVLDSIKELTNNIKIFGVYQKGSMKKG